MGEEGEDEAVDSGWELEERAPATVAVSVPHRPPAKKSLARESDPDLSVTTEVPLPDSLDFDITSEVPGAMTVRGGADSRTRRLAGQEEAEPPTRRASDEELGSKAPPLRLGGRSQTPMNATAAAEAKRADVSATNRPTPPANAAVTTSLRFSTKSLRDSRNRRKTTKINLHAIDLDAERRAALEEQAQADARERGVTTAKPPPSPDPDDILDLHLPDAFEVDLEASFAEAKASSPSTARTQEISLSPEAAKALGAVEPAKGGLRRPPAQTKPAMRIGGQGTTAKGLSVEQSIVARGSVPSPPRAPAKAPSLKPPGASPGTVARSGGGLRPPPKKTPASPLGKATVLPDVDVDLKDAELSDDELAAISSEIDSLDLHLEPRGAATEDAAAPAKTFELLDDPGESLRLSAPSKVETERSPDDPDLLPIRQRFERGDYMGALLRAEALLEQRPDFAQARRYLESAQELLHQMYLEKLGSGEQVLRLAMGPGDIQGLSLDHRAGFLISLIDGVATIDELLDMSGMPPLDALRLLYEMKQQGVVAIDSLARL